MDSQEHAVTQAIEARRDDLVDLLSALIAFDTTATPGNDAREHAPLQQLLARRLAGAGLAVDVWEPASGTLPADRMGLAADYSFAGRPQLVARWRGEGGGPSLLLNGHVDVVDAGPRSSWSGDPFRARVLDGRLIGRGAADMKGGVAAMVVAVEALRAAGVRLAGDLVVNTVTDEESTGAGSVASLQRGLGVDAGLIPEPTGLDVWLGARGSLRSTISVEGRAGHAGLAQPHWSAGGAVNAVDKMRVVLAALEGVAREWRERHASAHPHLGPGGIVPTAIHADAWMVSHPGTCTLECHLQYVPAQADADGWGAPVQREIEQALSFASQADTWLREHPPQISWSPDVPASLVDADSPIVHGALAAAGAVGRRPRIVRETTFFDGPTFTRAGIPTIAFGPGDIVQAHAADEHVVVDELVAAAQAIAVAVMRFCGRADEPSAAVPVASPAHA